MYTEGFEQWFKMNKNMAAPISEVGKATTDICRSAAQRNLELLGENLARWSDQLKRLSNIRKPEEFLALQRDCMVENFNAGMENLQKITRDSLEDFEKVTKVFSATASKVTDTAMEKAQRYTEKAEK